MTLKNMSFAPLARLYVYLCAINMAGVLCSVCCLWERRFVIGGVLYYVLCERRYRRQSFSARSLHYCVNFRCKGKHNFLNVQDRIAKLTI